jgi:hypothetical protein
MRAGLFLSMLVSGCLYALSLMLTGCLYAPTPADGALRCNAGACPDGYYCAPDLHCWRDGHAPLQVKGGSGDLGALGAGDSAVPSLCANGMLDPGESDTDCGGPCPACANGKHCAVVADCQSKVCNMVNKTCVAGDCQDGVRDDQESDVDCGGPMCNGCDSGQACQAASDCANHICNVPKMICVASTCDDGVLDGSETDVDCGGGCPNKCKGGKVCLSTADCAPPSACDATHHCVAAQCTNGIRDVANPGANPPIAAETDIDCGGTVCGPCALGKGCLGGSDCQSGFCNAKTKVCVADQCHDGMKDGSESDVDCGGSCPTKCGNGQMCSGPSDCGGAGASCDGNHQCCAPSCSGKVCGSDGCGGSCGSCTSATEPQCSADGSSCQCSASSCASLGPQYACGGNGSCVCVPSCGGKVCGADGCGGVCGSCSAATPLCSPDGSGCSCSASSCASLGSNYTCNGSGQCVCTPSCSGRQCGSDGCGGSCGSCSTGLAQCNGAGRCVLGLGTRCPDPSGYPCGTGNCVDGVCCGAAACSTAQNPCSSCNTAQGAGSCGPVYNATTANCNGNRSCGASPSGVWCGLNQFAACTASSQCLGGCCSAAGTYKNECGNFPPNGCLSP